MWSARCASIRTSSGVVAMKAVLSRAMPTVICVVLFFYVVNNPEKAGGQIHGLLTWLTHVMNSFATFAGSIQ